MYYSWLMSSLIWLQRGKCFQWYLILGKSATEWECCRALPSPLLQSNSDTALLLEWQLTPTQSHEIINHSLFTRKLGTVVFMLSTGTRRQCPCALHKPQCFTSCTLLKIICQDLKFALQQKSSNLGGLGSKKTKQNIT